MFTKRMEVSLFTACILFIMITAFSYQPNQANAQTVTLEGGQAVDNRVLVPLRSIFEEIGATVQWDQQTNKITAKKDNRTVILFVDSRHTYVNGTHHLIDVPAKAINGRTLVPLRFISESFGGNVHWNSASYQAIIQMADKTIVVNVVKPAVRPTQAQIKNLLKQAEAAQFSFDGSRYYTRAQIDNRLNKYFTKSFIDTFLAERWEYTYIGGVKHYFFYGSDNLYLYLETDTFYSWDWRTKFDYTQNQSSRIITVSEKFPGADLGPVIYYPLTYQVQLVESINKSDGYKVNNIRYLY
ncbi:copper amine oxidase N-terminal domain-containing protein [Alkalihalophilus marmarensis]|uniref:Copper amine oxidase-like N-terminal domain-containing protein n=1 Tax=Alkalihalophilus marmarensis DSM 21297 TaxID=1188261 RepID=U6SK09_9BACI|nr:copper amine oxidase N-terminal domain-containing protein [Alkalihalophilus marmarensis]ERN52059.1 hypothetical protein A33I_18370 [Alkalihalophilus marmarensis DSM 21297]